MAVPSPTSRETPDGIPLKDGYQTLITIEDDPNISFWEKTVQPPGLDGGDKVDITTMHNTALRTYVARSLTEMTDMRTRVSYDPDAYDEILAVINTNDVITVKFSDGSTIAFWGYLRSFEPADISEGSQPEADIVICPTNYDGSAEQNFVLDEVAGT